MHEPTERVRRAERSKIRVMFDLAETTDRDLVRLEVGDPDFDTPAHVVDAAAEAARGGATHYTPNAGLPACRRAISDAMADDYGVEHDIDEIAVGRLREVEHHAYLGPLGPPDPLGRLVHAFPYGGGHTGSSGTRGRSPQPTGDPVVAARSVAAARRAPGRGWSRRTNLSPRRPNRRT